MEGPRFLLIKVVEGRCYTALSREPDEEQMPCLFGEKHGEGKEG